MPVLDQRNYSLITFSALKNNLLALKIVVEHALSFGETSLDSAEMRDWVNQKTDRGYTALHFAAFHGNIEMIRYLVETLKADIHAQNMLDQNVLHFAAQGDTAAAFVYFSKHKNMEAAI